MMEKLNSKIKGTTPNKEESEADKPVEIQEE